MQKRKANYAVAFHSSIFFNFIRGALPSSMKGIKVLKSY